MPQMKWTRLRYRLREVDAAGEALLDVNATPERVDWALEVINNWRGAHSFPLNTFQVTLRDKAHQVHRRAAVAQRLKRLYSIRLKLRNLKWLRLSEMQDIGGCRAILPSVDHVRALVERYRTSDLRHILDDEDDYIEEPKTSGYRGIHLIYRYHSERTPKYNGRKIEMQFRSQAQHVWATAVETAGVFTGQALKSSQGDKRWLRFFALMATDTALREWQPPVPGTPTGRAELVAELRALAQELDVVNRLMAFGVAVGRLPRGRATDRYFLVQLDATARQVRVSSYSQLELDLALTRQSEAERETRDDANADSVLVSVESVAALRAAYPNYFLDTHRFLAAVRRVIGGR